MDQAAKQTLEKKLEAGALAAGFPTEQWTQARVKQVIEQEFGVVYHRKYISRLLHKMGWSVQKPDSRAMERDIAFNPEKSFNCQARSAALYVAFYRTGDIDKM